MQPRDLSELEDFLIESPARYDVVAWRIGSLDLWPLLLTSILNLRIQMEVGQQKSHITVGGLPWKLGVLADHLVVSPLRARLKPRQAALPPDDLDGKILFHASRLHSRDMGPLRLCPPIDIPAALMSRLGTDPVVWMDDIASDSPELDQTLIRPTRGLRELTSSLPAHNERGLAKRVAGLPSLRGWLKEISFYFDTSCPFMTVWINRVIGKALDSASLYARIFSERGVPQALVMTNCGFANTVGLTASAKALGIPVIEIQHGAESRSAITSRFHAIHFSRFNSAPDALVSWDLKAPRDERIFPVGPIGLLTVDIVDPVQPDDPESYRTLRKMIDEQKDVLENGTDRGSIAREVVVSLQPGDRGEWLSPIVANMPDTFFWVRRHGADAADDVNLIKVSGHDRVDVENATRTLLPVLLARCDAHLTRFSAVVLEAAACGLPSVVTEPYAVELYADKVQPELLTLAQDSEAIICALVEASVRKDAAYAGRAADRCQELTQFLMRQSTPAIDTLG